MGDREATFKPGVIETLTATAAITPFHFVKGDGSLCGAGERAAGVSWSSAAAAGDTFGVILTGKALVIAGSTLVAGVEVESDASGQAALLSTGKAVGITLSSASTGQELEIKVL